MNIRYLPTMPQYRHVYTCPKCGCHTVYKWQARFDHHKPFLVICRACHTPYEWRPEPRRRKGWGGRGSRTPEESEIEEAVRAASQQ